MGLLRDAALLVLGRDRYLVVGTKAAPSVPFDQLATADLAAVERVDSTREIGRELGR